MADRTVLDGVNDPSQASPENPSTTTSPPVETISPPVETISPPVETISPPVETTTTMINETAKSQATPVETVTFRDTVTSTAAAVPTNTATPETKLSEPTETGKSSTGGAGAKKSTKTGGEGISLLISCILIIIPILEVIIGSKYQDKCPANSNIPRYLFVAGIVGIIILALTFIQAILGLSAVKRAFNDDNGSNLLGLLCKICGICGIGFVIFGLAIFLFAWFIAGCVWVFGAWSTVQYRDKNQPNYCNKILYRFAFWLLLLSIIRTLYPCVKVCYSARKSPSTNKNTGAMRLQTSEP